MTPYADAATLLISALLLSWVAFYNRYPLVWPDTGYYLHINNFGLRSIFYIFFVYPSHLIGSLWAPVLAQALMVAYLLRLVVRIVFGITSRLEFLIIILLLCVLTGLPWCTSLLMPDIFGAVLILGLFLLAFCRSELTRSELFIVIGLTFLALTVHYSHVPIAAGLLVIGIFVGLAMRNRVPQLVPHLMLPTLLLAVAVIAIVLSNYATLGLLSLSPAGYSYELARLQEDGQAVSYLRQDCPTRKYRICKDLDRLPMDAASFLWSPGSPLAGARRMEDREEGMQIVTRTIERYPRWTLRSAIRNTRKQVMYFEAGSGLISYADSDYPTHELETFYPAEVNAYFHSRQNLGEFQNLDRLNQLHLVVIVLSCIFCGFSAVLLVRRRQWIPLAFLGTIGLAVLINGFVMGALSMPTPRYGTRVIWLIPLAALALWRKAPELRELWGYGRAS